MLLTCSSREYVAVALYNSLVHIASEEKRKAAIDGSWIDKQQEQQQQKLNKTKQQKNKNKNFATMLYKFLSLGWSELSDYNLHILDKKNSLFNFWVVKDDPGQA